MNHITKLFITAISLFTTTIVIASGAAHWAYEGPEGPQHWGDLSHDFHLCKEGKKQSPVDITNAKLAHLNKISFRYTSEPKEILNNGHTIQVNMKKGSVLKVDGKTYNLIQFHFHAPSEHTFNAQPADMVAHFVHQTKEGQLGVIGLLFRISKNKSNKTLGQLWKYLPHNTGDKRAIAPGITVAKLLPKNTTYYHYSGSLTTPPCSENVNWMILQNSVAVSRQQVAAFSNIIQQNVRPIQALNGREIEGN